MEVLTAWKICGSKNIKGMSAARIKNTCDILN